MPDGMGWIFTISDGKKKEIGIIPYCALAYHTRTGTQEQGLLELDFTEAG